MTIAWLSGSSDPARSALTDDELGLLEAVAGGTPGAWSPPPPPPTSGTGEETP